VTQHRVWALPKRIRSSSRACAGHRQQIAAAVAAIDTADGGIVGRHDEYLPRPRLPGVMFITPRCDPATATSASYTVRAGWYQPRAWRFMVSNTIAEHGTVDIIRGVFSRAANDDVAI
jgi:hypothetical protein